MSLNNIEFSKRNIADLYKSSLVELSDDNLPVPTSLDQPQWKYLGENRKKVLIVVNYADVVHIPDRQLAFLTNLLSACKLNLGDTAVLNFYHNKAKDFNSIISYFAPKTIFLFGVEPAEFGMPMLFPQFQVQSFKESIYLFAPSLQETEPDKILKSKLWTCFKKIFNL
jgi:hypothetical protein